MSPTLLFTSECSASGGSVSEVGYSILNHNGRTFVAVFLSAQKHLINTCEGQVDRGGHHVICHKLAKSSGWKEGFHTLEQMGIDSATHTLALKTEEVDNSEKKSGNISTGNVACSLQM